VSAPSTLTTKRLVLRRPVPGDARAMFDAYSSDPEVTRFLTWTTHENVERAHTFLRRCDAVWAEGSAYPWAITVAGRLIGMIEVRLDGHRAEIGYAISRAAWGQGYATEAARAVVDWAVTQPAIRRVWAYTDVENAPSARVLEKIGMAREGKVRAWYVPSGFGVPRDCWMYGRVKETTEPLPRPAASLVAAVAAVPSPAAPARDGATHLETPRLVLRPPSVDDAETVFSSYAQDPAVSRYTSWAPHGRVENTREFLRFCEEGWARGTLCSWVIARRDDGRLVGMTDIRLDGHRGEIGYVLAQGAWGQGYATEVARAVVAWGLAQPALHRIWAVCDLENKASARVLEKVGMTREGCLRAWASMPAFSAPRDVWCYAAIKTIDGHGETFDGHGETFDGHGPSRSTSRSKEARP
jgi:ribosomal-protein-alanine N-acetyltransferase